MIAGRRGMQPTEIQPTAEYLGWTMEQLLEKLPEEARVVPQTLKTTGIPVLATTSHLGSRRLGFASDWRDDTLRRSAAGLEGTR